MALCWRAYVGQRTDCLPRSALRWGQEHSEIRFFPRPAPTDKALQTWPRRCGRRLAAGERRRLLRQPRTWSDVHGFGVPSVNSAIVHAAEQCGQVRLRDAVGRNLRRRRAAARRPAPARRFRRRSDGLRPRDQLHRRGCAAALTPLLRRFSSAGIDSAYNQRNTAMKSEDKDKRDANGDPLTR